jgi:uncharacterized protein with NAD-binding domain and iron-sulfur cluster
MKEERMGKTKLAILGGGMSSLVTAWKLTSLPDWKDRYEITVYQQGWRLGGKGASGRNPDMGNRIEEHGLHLMFGFYENVFNTMRGCYTELSNDPDAWTRAFEPYSSDVTMIEKVDGNIEPWSIPCPRNSHTPGDGNDLTHTPWIYVRNLLEWIRREIDQKEMGVIERIRGKLADLREFAAKLRDDAAPLGPEGFPALATLLADAMPHATDEHEPGDHDLLHFLSSRFVSWFAADKPDQRRPVLLADLAYTMAKGLIADLVLHPERTWFDLDEWDLREWLSRHGAREETLNSPQVAGWYDAVFSTNNPLGAGTIMQAMLRAAFTYKGAVMYKMRGGMGDVIFAPLYRVLSKRGVVFKFFHRVDQIDLSDDKTRVERVRLTRQVETRGEYQPLFPLDGIDCWPNRPIYEQIDADPNVLREHDLESGWDDLPGTPVALQAGRDFDQVVLGISVGAIGRLCQDLMFDTQNPQFQWMVKGIRTTQTQALQLWFKDADIGWRGETIVPYEEPFDTVARMDHLLAHEHPATPVGTIAYLCSPLDDDAAPPAGNDRDYPRRQLARAQANGMQWLSQLAGPLWPNARDNHPPGSVDWSRLADPKDQAGAARFDSQYWVATANPSDRYVLPVRGSHRYRLGANQSGYDNLIITGDWIRTALSVGCLEAATMAGIQAARAIDDRVPAAAGDWLGDPQPRKRGELARWPATKMGSASPAPAPPADSTSPVPFVPVDGDLMPKPPITLDIMLYTWLLDADYAHLKRVCDAYLNHGGATEYRPLGPFVILYSSSINNIVNPWGECAERDFGFWIPVAAGRRQAGGFQIDRILTFTPYIWVDNGWAIVGGRSVFGFPKQLGEMGMPIDDNDPAKFSLKTIVLSTVPSTAKMDSLLEITRTDAPTRGALTSSFGGWAQLLERLGPVFEKLLRVDGPLRSWPAIAGLLTHPGLPMVFLKQFPDASSGSNACYQAIIEAPVDIVEGLHVGGPLEGRYEVVIRTHESHRIVETLGLATVAQRAGGSVLNPLLGGWGKLRACIGAGTTIWP